MSRGPRPRLTLAQINEAIDGSLKRLKNRLCRYLSAPLAGTGIPTSLASLVTSMTRTRNSPPIEETLGALHDLVQAGKIRHIGLSNETPWGLMKFLELAEKKVWAARGFGSEPLRAFEPQPMKSVWPNARSAKMPVFWRIRRWAVGHCPGKYIGGARPEGATHNHLAAIFRPLPDGKWHQGDNGLCQTRQG